MASQCKNRMNNNGPSFSSKGFKYNKYGHKSNECKTVMNNFQNRRNIRCNACGRFGNVSNQFRSRGN